MILKKLYYRARPLPLTTFKSLSLILLKIWKSFTHKKTLSNWSVLEELKKERVRGRPFLTNRSRVLAGNWEWAQEICPTKCLQIHTDKGKLTAMWLERERCIHCGLCVDAAPAGGVELRPAWEEEQINESSFDLVQEREA